MEAYNIEKLVVLRPVEEEYIDPKDYLAMSEQDRAKIEFTRIVPSKLGDGTFGKILVKYRYPIFKLN